jgi:hypothetical protein
MMQIDQHAFRRQAADRAMLSTHLSHHTQYDEAHHMHTTILELTHRSHQLLTYMG